VGEIRVTARRLRLLRDVENFGVILVSDDMPDRSHFTDTGAPIDLPPAAGFMAA